MQQSKQSFIRRWRYVKTMFLGLAALATLIWGAIYSFEVEGSEILSYLWLSLALLLVIVLISLLGAGLIIALRKWRE